MNLLECNLLEGGAVSGCRWRWTHTTGPMRHVCVLICVFGSSMSLGCCWSHAVLRVMLKCVYFLAVCLFAHCFLAVGCVCFLFLLFFCLQIIVKNHCEGMAVLPLTHGQVDLEQKGNSLDACGSCARCHVGKHIGRKRWRFCFFFAALVPSPLS